MRESAADPGSLEGVIVDLDGVVTDTASLHRVAWKETFDELLRRLDPSQPPFDERDEYDRYVDGKARLEGVRSFLGSRGIELPEGDEGDGVGDGTVRGVGNSKNARFGELLRERGATVFEDAVGRIRAWRRRGLATAVVSASRNCEAILESAGLVDLFDVRVDGVVAAELGLEGKPAPDLFLEAARRLGATPERTVVVEDALAGVESGRRGGFGRVVGVDRRGDRADALRRRGADIVVGSLDDWSAGDVLPERAGARPLLERLDEFAGRLGGRDPVVFLDYDGTLTPIVARPEDAVLGERMREAVSRLASACTVAIISGRDRADVEARVGLGDVFYAGSHGFDISGPEGFGVRREVGGEFRETVEEALEVLRDEIGGIEGVQIEPKRASFGVHVRNVADEDAGRVEEAVTRVVGDLEGLRVHRGKRVLEVQPDIDWDKGRAVLWLLEALGVDAEVTLPIYVGDDTTDEDAFRALRGRGIGVFVGPADARTGAWYALRDVEEVGAFLAWLAGLLEGRRGRGG